MVSISDIPAEVTILLFPIIAIGLWTLIFNSKNSYFTKIFVESGYLLVVIPLMVLTFLSVPAMMLMFWARATGQNREVTFAIVGLAIGMSIIVEYFYIKRLIRQVEEKEQLPIMQILRRELKRETHEDRRVKKEQTKDEAQDFFGEITVMNKKRRELDIEEKEKLRKALLGEIEQPTNPE